MSGYRVTQELDLSRWDAYVDSMPDGTCYHLSAWGKIIRESFGHPTHFLSALDQAGEVAGVLPLVQMKSALFGSFLVSVPFVNYGGVLCRDPRCAQALLAEAEELRRRCGAEHVELRHLGSSIEGLPTREHKVTMMLPLSADPDEQWAHFNAKLRNQIRKAQKSGLSFRTGSLELLNGFYDVFARNMRDLGTPVYGKEFFACVLGSLPRSTRIAVVQLEGKVVAAGILSRYKKSMEMPWASSIAEYKPLCPNNLLYWESIRLAIAEGCASFDFGRSTPNEGTYNFKKQWGAEPVPLYWQYLLEKGKALPELTPKNPKYQAAIAIWKRLPVRFTRLIGPAIVRNIP